LAFLANAWRETRAGRPPSPVKFLLMASSFGFFWFAMVVVSEPVFGLLIFEIFHDIQYNTLVWAYNRGRVDRGLGAGRLETFLFRPGAWRIALYAALVVAYGTVGVVTGYSRTLVPDATGPALGSVGFWTGLFSVSAFLHFYFDGFIWQVREKELRQGFGIEAKKEGKAVPPAPRRSRLLPQGWKWAFFVAPVALLGALELHGNMRQPLDHYRNLATLLPENPRLHYMVANLERFQKHYPEALDEYSRSLALDPGFQPAHVEAAAVAASLGLNELALSHYARAMELDSTDQRTHAYFATTLLRLNRVAEAVPHLLATAPLFPRDTNLVYLTGAALMHEHRPREAVPYLEQALRLDPGLARAWSYLGAAVRSQGDSAVAEAYYRRAQALDPRNAWR
jgi:Flp pilus assembly protein TadD